METGHLAPTPASPACSSHPPLGRPCCCGDKGVGKCLVSTANICPVSTADISISITGKHSASAFGFNPQRVIEAAMRRLRQQSSSSRVASNRSPNAATPLGSATETWDLAMIKSQRSYLATAHEMAPGMSISGMSKTRIFNCEDDKPPTFRIPFNPAKSCMV